MFSILLLYALDTLLHHIYSYIPSLVALPFNLVLVQAAEMLQTHQIAPAQTTFRQAHQCNIHVRKEKICCVPNGVYYNSIMVILNSFLEVQSLQFPLLCSQITCNCILYNIYIYVYCIIITMRGYTVHLLMI